jgi:hypothetical protein
MILSQTIALLERQWADLERRLQIVPGKEVFALFASRLQVTYGVTITARPVADTVRSGEIPEDLRPTIEASTGFANHDPNDTNGLFGLGAP